MDLEKFKSMPFRNKIRWVLQYYGIWIVVSIITICIAVSFVKSVFFPKTIEDIRVIILSDDYKKEETLDIENEISALTNGSTSVVIYNVSEEYGGSAFSIKIMSDQVDLILAPKEQTDAMIESGYLESSEKLSDGDLYLDIPHLARKGEMLDKTIEYFKGR